MSAHIGICCSALWAVLYKFVLRECTVSGFMRMLFSSQMTGYNVAVVESVITFIGNLHLTPSLCSLH